MALTIKQWLYLGAAAALLLGGWWFRDLLQDKKDFSNVKSDFKTLQAQGEKYDKALVDKLAEDAKTDAGVNKALDNNQEAARRAPTYRSYLDRPLPESALQLYRDAAKAIADAADDSARAAGAAPDEGDH